MKNIRYIIIGFIILCLFIFSLSFIDFSKKVNLATKDNLFKQNLFWKSFSFDGTVINKEKCEHCNLNKYRVIVKLNNFDVKKIKFENRFYEPYYSIDSNQLSLSVDKSIYINVTVGDSISKNENSNNLIIK